MFIDRKIRKAFKEQMKPDKPFEEFCAENGIVLEDGKKHARKTLPWKRFVLPFAAAAVTALCVVLPVTLTRGGKGGSSLPSVGKQYNVGSEVLKPVEFEALTSDPDLVLYDTQYERSNQYSAFLCADDGLLLAYVVKSVVYGGQVDGTLYAYQFDFLARCYDGYAQTYTLALEWYEDNGASYCSGGVDYYYGLVSGADGESAIICYENGKYDYFIRMRLPMAGSKLTDNDVENFIALAFGGDDTEEI